VTHRVSLGVDMTLQTMGRAAQRFALQANTGGSNVQVVGDAEVTIESPSSPD